MRFIELKKKYSMPTASDESLLLRERATVQGAIKLGKLDEETAEKLVTAGGADAQMCNDATEKCYNGTGNADNCMRFADEPCKRSADCK